jgi:hypothetical protein
MSYPVVILVEARRVCARALTLIVACQLDCCAMCGGGFRFVVASRCKSGKDRTGMAVTLEEWNALNTWLETRGFNIAYGSGESSTHLRDLLRSDGVRRDNVRCVCAWRRLASAHARLCSRATEHPHTLSATIVAVAVASCLRLSCAACASLCPG